MTMKSRVTGVILGAVALVFSSALHRRRTELNPVMKGTMRTGNPLKSMVTCLIGLGLRLFNLVLRQVIIAR